jgi:mRNA interferase HicA
MKRRDLIKHRHAHGCELQREGGNHTIYVHRGKRTSSSIPRKREINEFLTRRVCRDLQVPEPGTEGGVS